MMKRKKSHKSSGCGCIVVGLVAFMVTSASINVQPESPVQPADIIFTSEVVRIGDNNVIISQFSFKEYSRSCLSSVDTVVNDPFGTIRVPFNKGVEVELHYEPMDVKASQLFGGGSRFQIVPDPRVSPNPTSVRFGKLQSWKIDSERAVVYFSPWLHAPHGDGGTVKLELTLETTAGKLYSRTWTFQVGRNPRVHKTEF